MIARAVFVASSGGHLDELVQLRPTLVQPDTQVTWVTFDTAHSRSLLRHESDVVFIGHVGPRGYLGLLKSIVPALLLLLRIRPQAVFSTGAAVALAFLPMAWLVGARATYVESAARTASPSQTGRLLRLFPWIRLRTQYRSWAGRRWQYECSVFDGLRSFHIDNAQRPAVRRVVVTLGTQPRFPFVSLVRRMSEIVPAGVEVFWQIGTGFPTAYRPFGAHDLVPAATLADWVSRADAVVAHGGVGSALTALRAGHKPVLVARRAHRNEHIDDHQVQLVDELIDRDLAIAASVEDLTWAHIVAATHAVVEPSEISADLELAAVAAAQRGAHELVEAPERSAPVAVATSVAADIAAIPSGDDPAGDAPTAGSVRRRALASVAVIMALFGSSAAVDQADAVGSGSAQTTVPNAVPTKTTPNITDGTVYAITQVGNLIIAGGSFTTVESPGGGASAPTMTRTNVLAFDATTGAVSTSFAPTLDGTVEALTPGPVAGTVYVGGYFNTINGARMKGLALLDTSTGLPVSGFKPPSLNGAVLTLATVPGRVLAGGTFTVAGGLVRGGLLSANASSGAVDDYLNVALAGHHNYNGTTGAKGPVGARAMAINPSGTRLAVLGNFKTANGLARDQAAMIDLGSTSATVGSWATNQFSAPCGYKSFDTYVSDVQFSPDGSYFVVVTTGGGTFTTNTDGTRSLCDAASRWDASSTSSNAMPTWVDYTGNDTLWSVAITNTAVYVGGHQRWLNNPAGGDSAGAGAVPRPGLAALDPVSGVPLSWNPGRNPRGAGAYVLFVNANGLYVGSDTDYIGDFTYTRRKIAYFTLADGTPAAATSTASLPANVFLAGPTRPEVGYTANSLNYRAVNGSRVGPTTATSGGSAVNWGDTRGAFVAGSTLFFATSSGGFYRAPIAGSTVGAPVAVDPYNDPYWSNVRTGSGSSVYRGVKPSYYSGASNVTGAFYSAGRMFYTVSGSSALYWRWFSPDSGIVGGSYSSTSGFDLSKVAGMFASGGYIYWASSADGTLHRVQLSGTTAVAGTDTVVGGPAIDGRDWRARSLFAFGPATFPNVAPTASATSSCAQLTCTFDGTGSADSDGTVASYAWTFGDGTTGTGANPQHGYASSGTYTVSLTVTDDRGGTAQWNSQVTAAAPSRSVGFVGTSGANLLSANPSVTVPSAVQAGDTELLYVSTATAGVTSTPDGWTQLARQTNSSIETTVFTRTATAADAGSTVGVTLSASTRVDVTLVAYSGAAGASAVTSGDTNTAAHVTPSTPTTTGGSWVVSYWSSRTSDTSSWSASAGVAVRGTGAGTGGGHVDTLVADAGPFASGEHGTLTANSGVVGGKGAMVSVVLVPTP